MWSVRAICCEDMFCASKKGGIEGCGCTYSHEVPCTWKLSVESCKKILAGTGWTISLLFSTETAPYFCRVSISGTAGSLQLGETFVGRKGSDYWKLANVGGSRVGQLSMADCKVKGNTPKSYVATQKNTLKSGYAWICGSAWLSPPTMWLSCVYP